MNGILELDKKSLVVVSNKLIDARYRLNISEIRLFVLMIFAFDKVRGEVRMSAKDVAGIVGLKGDFYSALKRATQNLMRQIITIEEENGNWEAYNITSKASCIDGVFTIKPNPQIEQYLINLKKCFTKYELAYGLALKSTYGFRLYQFGKKNLGLKKPVVQIDLEEFRKMLGIAKSEYKHIWNLKKKVLDVAQQDVNTITDIEVSCRSIKQGLGGKIVKLEFTFSEKEKKPAILSEMSTIAYTEEGTEEGNENILNRENSAPISEGARLLLENGISENVAIQLAEQYETVYLQEKVALANAHGEYVKNKAGFLFQAIKENWLDNDIVQEQQKEIRLNDEKRRVETRKRVKGIWDRYRVKRDALGLKKYEKMASEEIQKLKDEFLAGLKDIFRNVYRKKENFGYEDGMFQSFFLSRFTLPSFEDFLVAEEITLSDEEQEILEKEVRGK
ncbi:MAG: replication initiation protein [Nitrosomonas ureae]